VLIELQLSNGASQVKYHSSIEAGDKNNHQL